MKIADSAVETPARRWQPPQSMCSRASAASTRSPFSILARGTPERAGERRAPAEPRDRNRGIGGAAAVDDEEALRLRLAVRLRKAPDLEHLVEHDDAGAQDRASVAHLTFLSVFAASPS